jgi:hypothetical protein
MHCRKNIVSLVKNTFWRVKIDCLKSKTGENWRMKTALAARRTNFFEMVFVILS